METLLFYKTTGKYGPFTNFFMCKKPIVVNGQEWLNSEQYYQAMKFDTKNPDKRYQEYYDIIKLSDSPMKSKMLGHQTKNMRWGTKWKINKKFDERLVNDIVDKYSDLKMRSDWDTYSVKVMTTIIYHKFLIKEHRDLLTSVNDNTYIVEHTKRDKIWGDGGDGGSGKIGENKLGKILTTVGHYLRNGNFSKMNKSLKEKVRI